MLISDRFALDFSRRTWRITYDPELQESSLMSLNPHKLCLLLAHSLVSKVLGCIFWMVLPRKDFITILINDVCCPPWPPTETLAHYCRIFFLDFLIKKKSNLCLLMYYLVAHWKRSSVEEETICFDYLCITSSWKNIQHRVVSNL